jgi:hypothetical protein
MLARHSPRSLSGFARQTTTGGLGEAQTRWIARAAQSSRAEPISPSGNSKNFTFVRSVPPLSSHNITDAAGNEFKVLTAIV